MYLQVYFKSGVLVLATCAADPHSGEIELKDQHFTQCPLPIVYSCLATYRPGICCSTEYEYLFLPEHRHFDNVMTK